MQSALRLLFSCVPRRLWNNMARQFIIYTYRVRAFSSVCFIYQLFSYLLKTMYLARILTGLGNLRAMLYEKFVNLDRILFFYARKFYELPLHKTQMKFRLTRYMHRANRITCGMTHDSFTMQMQRGHCWNRRAQKGARSNYWCFAKGLRVPVRCLLSLLPRYLLSSSSFLRCFTEVTRSAAVIRRRV